jgi:spore coat polysaccharide biosynthesis predicted glycosyltransferase SpsG
MGAPGLRVLFRVAAGPTLGYGHLVRARSLARALGVPAHVSVRGAEAAGDLAAFPGVSIADPTAAALDDTNRPDVLVVDDPGQADTERWILGARERGVPAVAIVDRGLVQVDADLVVDGSIEASSGPGVFGGPMYAVLDPAIAVAREMPPTDRSGLLIALGGGSHVHVWGAAIARAIHERLPQLRVRIAGGFAQPPSEDRGRTQWVAAPAGLADELRRASVAVVAGGMTMYEAAALAVPAAALAVVRAQQPAIAGFARRGAVLNAGFAGDPASCARAADAVITLFTHRQRAARQAAGAARLVDGRGVFRAADLIRSLAGRPKDHSHAA